MNVQLECEVTEFNVMPDEENEKNIFYFHEKSLVISFANKDEEVISQSEISREDTIRLAKLILHLYT
jgi:hypothetical protein